MPPRLELLDLLGPGPTDELWEADKSGWRCFVMGNHQSCYRPGTPEYAAWKRGYDAAARFAHPELLML